MDHRLNTHLTIAPQPKTALKTQLLFVEDDVLFMEVLSDVLCSKGYEVIQANNGYEAIDRVQAGKPALILMDIRMPYLDGLETIRQLRKMPIAAKLPIIALTGLTMPGDRERCLEAGADWYLAKPVSIRILLITIEHLLNR